jgi:Ca-activated chloride channel family protein
MKKVRVSIVASVALAALAVAVILTACDSRSYMRPAGAVDAHPQYSTGFAPTGADSAVARHNAPTGSLPSLDEEVWVIVKPAPGSVKPRGEEEELPGSGAMMCRLPSPDSGGEPKDVPLPLQHTEVHTQISAYIASVNVTQQFHNPYDSKIEAVYVFPLPQNAAVNGFIMIIGERRIRGIIREREEAQRIYNEAKSQGYVASLLTQERPNIFTQHVANIEPGNSVDVQITYFHTLAYDDGWYEYVFPMVVGPRFNPPTSGGDGIGAVGYGQHGTSGQKTEVQYLRPNERSGHDIGVTVDITAGIEIEEIVCKTHRVNISHEASEQMRITLNEEDRIPNKDFVLRYRVAGETVKTALLTHKDSAGQGYFTFMLFPPQDTALEQRMPMEMIFVLDCSGSMSGKPIDQARAAIDHALTQLQPGDTFQVISFSDKASQLGSAPVPATGENIKRGRQYVRSLSAGGGTMMINGIRAALNFDHDPERLRIVTFLTDGYIGNESEILSEMHRLLGASRVFSFGVGSSVNRFLLDRMAKLGRGAVAYLGLNDSGRDVMNAFYARVSRPVLTDIEIDWGGMHVSDVVASGLDLFVGRPVIYTGKFAGNSTGTICVRGNAAGHLVEAKFNAESGALSANHPALASVWARMHIAELMDHAMYATNNELSQQITMIALQHSLMSAYTSFVAVDSSARTSGDHGTTVQVAVPVPAGVKYETTVSE